MADARKTFQHILITGPPGVGKTTLIQKLCKSLKNKNIPIKGFYTEENRQNGVRTGFDIVDLDGARKPLARIMCQENTRFPKVGKYSVDVDSFESLALPTLHNSQSSSVMVIDEIGKMELFSQKFKQSVNELFSKSKVAILATVPIRSIPFVDHLRKLSTAKVFTVTKKNRDTAEKEILSALSISSER